MADKRTVTIGVTINLGNYESLRVEVSDTAENETAVRDLADFLGRTLDEFGTRDASTRAAVERYKERVLDKYAQEEEEEEAGYYPMNEMPLTHPVEEEEEEIPMQVLEDTRIEVPPAEETSVPEVIADQAPAVSPPEGEFVCEKCGVSISKVQRDVSNLFMGKTLCKKCMK
jgi:tRNA U55 pseudouridine synthase TruB